MEAEAEAFLENKSKVEVAVEANFISKKFWKPTRKQFFFEKNFGSGSEFFLKKKNWKRKRKRSQNQPLPKHCLQLYNIVLYSPTTGAPPNLILPLKKIDEVDHPKFIALFLIISIITCAPKFA